MSGTQSGTQENHCLSMLYTICVYTHTHTHTHTHSVHWLDGDNICSVSRCDACTHTHTHTLLRSGLETLPHNAKIHYNYANYLRDTDRPEEAAHHYTQALQLVINRASF